MLEPILANPDLSTGPLRAYLAPLSTVVKRVDNGTNDLIREVIAQDPKSFASFSAWKPMTPNAVVIFCSWDIQSREGPWPFFLTKLLPQAPVSEFRSREVVDRDFQESALLQISFQNALPEKGWAHAGLMELDKTVSSFPIKPDCPTILCSIKLNPEASSAEIKRATNDVKTFFVKALNDFNSQLAEIAAARNKNAAPGNRAATK